MVDMSDATEPETDDVVPTRTRLEDGDVVSDTYVRLRETLGRTELSPDEGICNIRQVNEGEFD